MLDRWQPVPMTRRRRAQRAIGATVLTLVLSLFMSLVADKAHACAPGAFAVTSISHQFASESVLKAKAVIAAQVMRATASTSNSVPGLGTCCGSAWQAHGSGCQQGSCAFCAVAVFDAASGIIVEKSVSDYVLAPGEDVTPASPDPNFRPPCLA